MRTFWFENAIPKAPSIDRPTEMQSFGGGAPTQQNVSLNNFDRYCNSQSQFYIRSDDGGGRIGTRLTDLGELEHSSGSAFIHIDAINLSRCSDYSGFKSSSISVVPNSMQFDGLTSSEMESSGIMGFGGSSTDSLSNVNIKNWGDPLIVPQQKLQTDTSTKDDGKNQFPGVQHKNLMAADSIDSSKAVGDQKALRRLAQNREAARKSRLRRKAYVQQLEGSRVRLKKLEKDLKRAQTQGVFAASGASGERTHSIGCRPTAFDIDYTRWLDEQQYLITDLRTAVNTHASDTELQLIVDEVMLHYDEVFRLKDSGAKSDVFHILSGAWKTPAERSFMWLGGFRASETLKVLQKHIEPLTEEQLLGIRNLHQSSQQAEDALNQGMDALQQSLVKTLSSNSLGPHGTDNITDYMEQMTVAMRTLSSVGNFLHQADLLRLKMLQQLPRILTIRQAARALLAFNGYNSRIRALSSLWQARPRG